MGSNTEKLARQVFIDLDPAAKFFSKMWSHFEGLSGNYRNKQKLVDLYTTG